MIVISTLIMKTASAVTIRVSQARRSTSTGSVTAGLPT